MAVKGPWLQVAVWAQNPDVASNPVAVGLSVNGRRVIDQSIASPDPLMYVVKIGDAEMIWLEVTASRTLDDQRALRVAHQWLEEPPRNLPPDRIIQ
jgi:hypothetical protein